MRLWLLGSWMANGAGRRLVLVNLIPAGREQDIEERFGPHVVSSAARLYVRCTWERIRERIRALDRPELRTLVEHLDHKTVGFDASGCLRLAFAPEAGA
jgi:hypothetical protein